MFPAAFLTSLLLLAISVNASPALVPRQLVTLPFSKRVNTTGVSNIVKHDVLRAAALREHGLAKAAGKSVPRQVTSTQAENQAVQYIASVGVGSPATTYDLVIDTGSSNTWVGAGTAYKKTSTSKSTGQSVSVTYGSGSFSGTEFTDTVTLGSGLVIKGQSIGVASTSSGFEGVDGILGIGPDDLTEGTLSSSSTIIPTVTDNLASAGTIGATVVGISFEPATSADSVNGELTWGGVDSSKFTGSIGFVPITSTSPASEFWGIDQSIAYGTSTILSKTAGIVDTGTTLILIATNAFNKYKSDTGATLDSSTGLLTVTSSKFSALKNLVFTTDAGSYTLTPNGQIWPRSLNSAIGGVSGKIYLVVADIGNDSGSGLDFINGQTFLERFYSVFDTDNQQVGLATTSFTTSTSN